MAHSIRYYASYCQSVRLQLGRVVDMAVGARENSIGFLVNDSFLTISREYSIHFSTNYVKFVILYDAKVNRHCDPCK